MKLKDDNLRTAILTTTTKLIITQGIEGTSTVKVAKRLKISQSNIYSYFKNKQTLLLAVFKLHQTKLIDYLANSLKTIEQPEAQIDHVLMGLIQFGLDQPQSLQVIVTFRQHISMRSQLPTIEDDAFFRKLFAQIIQYQQAQLIKPYPAQFLAEGVFSIINNYLISIHSGELTVTDLPASSVIALVKSFLLVTPEK